MRDAARGESVAFDPRALVEPVDRAAVREYTRRVRQSGAMTSLVGTLSAGIALVIGVVFVVAFLSVFLTIAASVISAFASSGEGSAWIVVVGSFLPLVIIVGAFALIITAVVRGLIGGQERWYRLDRFARANGMAFVPTLPAPALPGMIFGAGGSRTASDLVRGTEPRFVEFANYQYTTGSGKNRTTHRWGYVAIKLDVPLPHIVLDATSNNGLFGSSNLPATFDKDQRLSLEGDFDQHFSLYCPAGYEPDALYLFTPDIMARFIDNAAALDVEIVDDWLFLYGKRDFSTLDPATWAWLFSVVAALLDKLARWARWRDERLRADASAAGLSSAPAIGDGAAAEAPVGTALPFVAPAGTLRPPPGVATPGRRLQRRYSWVSIIAIVAVVLFWLLSRGGFLGMLFPDRADQPRAAHQARSRRSASASPSTPSSRRRSRRNR